MTKKISRNTRQIILAAQETEITEHTVYHALATIEHNHRNKHFLDEMADDEHQHYLYWEKYTGQEIQPHRVKVSVYFIIARILGLTFALRLMERGEQRAQQIYQSVAHEIPEVKTIIQDEDRHEQKILALLKEDRMLYVGSIVLGLNDALVELTGALAGFTLAFQNNRIIAVAGLITGIAASFSMAASEYLSTKTDSNGLSPLRASIYTGIAYVFTVLFLIFPYLIFHNIYLCLVITLFNAVIVILAFTFYISVAQNLSFKHRFIEMALISMGISAFTFLIGLLIRQYLQIDI